MKKLLSIFAAVGLTTTTASTVVACGDKAISFSGSADLSIELGDKPTIFDQFIEDGISDIHEQMADFNKKLSEKINDGGDIKTIDYKATLTSSDEKVATVEVIEDKIASFTTIAEGKTQLDYTQSISLEGKTIAEIKWTINLTVTAKEEGTKPSFSFNF